MKIKIISLEKCKYYFNFDEETGELFWKVSKQGIQKGDIAGSLNKLGYFCVGIEGKIYKLHRILYQLYHNIELNDEFIDHIDMNKQNNSIENLRIATNSENQMNKKVQKNNLSTGIKNISIYTNQAGNEYFYIQITKDGKCVYRELFRTDKFTIDDVIKIRDEKLKELHGEFCNIGEKS